MQRVSTVPRCEGKQCKRTRTKFTGIASVEWKGEKYLLLQSICPLCKRYYVTGFTLQFLNDAAEVVTDTEFEFLTEEDKPTTEIQLDPSDAGMTIN